MTLCLHF